MKVFISWSGPESKLVADKLYDWLPNIIQATEPFVSGSIEAGISWLNKIGDELSESKVAILCVTPNNLTAPWLLFEAGALAKSINKPDTRVMPLCIGLRVTDLKPPLSIFQAVTDNKEGLFKMLNTINSSLESKLEEKRLQHIFDREWQELAPTLEEAKELLSQRGKCLTSSQHRSQQEIAEETLEVVRSLHKEVAYLVSARKEEVEKYIQESLHELFRVDFIPKDNLKDSNLSTLANLASLGNQVKRRSLKDLMIPTDKKQENDG